MSTIVKRKKDNKSIPLCSPKNTSLNFRKGLLNSAVAMLAMGVSEREECVCVCVCDKESQERVRERERKEKKQGNLV